MSVERLHPIEAYAPLLARLGYRHVPHADDVGRITERALAEGYPVRL